MADQWRELCLQANIDPEEVRLIYDRYDAYKSFTVERTNDSISLEQWFRFYNLEKNSEGLQAGAPVEGCSADGDAVNNACLKRPAEFLQVLKAYDAAQAAGDNTT